MMTSLAYRTHGVNHIIIYETSIISSLAKMKVHHFFFPPFKPRFYNLAQDEESPKWNQEETTPISESKP